MSDETEGQVEGENLEGQGPKKRGKRAIIIVAAALVLLLLVGGGGAAYFFLFASGGEEAEVKPEATSACVSWRSVSCPISRAIQRASASVISLKGALSSMF